VGVTACVCVCVSELVREREREREREGLLNNFCEKNNFTKVSELSRLVCCLHLFCIHNDRV
jgi:hypothetical protein